MNKVSLVSGPVPLRLASSKTLGHEVSGEAPHLVELNTAHATSQRTPVSLYLVSWTLPWVLFMFLDFKPVFVCFVLL